MVAKRKSSLSKRTDSQCVDVTPYDIPTLDILLKET